MISRNKREGRYTGLKKVGQKVRLGLKNRSLNYKKFRRDWFNAMAYVHWVDGIVEFYPVIIEVYPGYLYDEPEDEDD